MKIIGITGTIGSGKSTATNILKEKGAYIIDADKIVSSFYNDKGQVYTNIINTFGKDILDENACIDRKKLAAIVFKEKSHLEVLNKIVHPSVNEKIKEEIRIAKAQKKDLIVLDVPIPTKEGFLDLCDEVWVIISDIQIRIERIIRRNNISIQDAKSRINLQMTEEEYKKNATRIIENNGLIDELKCKVLELLRRLN